ncbi:MAG: ATP-dependent DNA ligase [Candidatus Hadarchaeales archaeon]
MKYLTLAETFEKLEKTSSYLEKNEIIVSLLQNTPPEYIEKVVLLLLGRAWPTYVSKETGVGIQQLKKAISLASGYPTSQVEHLLKKMGDLGEVAQELIKKKKQVSLFQKPLTVSDVFETIKRLPEITGESSIDRKIERVASLLTSAQPIEAKFIVRTVLGDLRIGVAEGRLRDAIADAFNIPPEDVEKAYMLTSDYALVAKTAAEKGIEGVRGLSVVVGRPVSPMLAQRAESIAEVLQRMNGKAAFEIKLDGIRIQAHKDGEKVILFTRRMEDYTSMFPDMIYPLRRAIKAEKAIVDGELVAIDPETKKPMPFQEVLKRRRKYGIEKTAKQIPVELHLFDVLLVDDRAMLERPYVERRKILEKIIEENEKVFIVEQKVLSREEEIREFSDYAIKIGHEGLLAKELNSPYRAGRREFLWLKIKPVLETLDLVVVGVLYGKGKRAGVFGSYILAARDPASGKFKTVTKCGSGFTDEDLKDLTELFQPLILQKPDPSVDIEIDVDAHVEPKIVFEVAYEEIQASPEEKHTSGFGLRFPRFIRIREDKRPEEAATINEIAELYRRQEERKAKSGAA